MKRPTASGDAARDAAGRLTTGSRVLADRITTGAAAWVRAGRRDDLTGIPAVLGCWGRLMTLAGAAYGLHAVLRAVPWGMWAATAVWCWKAWRAAAPPADDNNEPDAGEDGREQPEQGPAVDLTKAGPPSREQLAVALHEVADPHAHLSALARHLDVPAAAVRAGLDQAGIPVAGGVRAGGRVSTGVKREDFPPPPAPAGPRVVAAEPAGQPDNNNDNNSTVVERPHPGMVIIRDTADTALRRHHVQRP